MNLKEFIKELGAACGEAMKAERYGSAVIEGEAVFTRSVQISMDDGEEVEHHLNLEPDEVVYDPKANVVRIGFGVREVRPS